MMLSMAVRKYLALLHMGRTTEMSGVEAGLSPDMRAHMSSSTGKPQEAQIQSHLFRSRPVYRTQGS